jgi:hypothetical protein
MSCSTGKQPFPTETAARSALLDARISATLRNNQRRREQRYYACPHCHRWHLSSREDLHPGGES